LIANNNEKWMNEWMNEWMKNKKDNKSPIIENYANYAASTLSFTRAGPIGSSLL
jgi:hypothetical protein